MVTDSSILYIGDPWKKKLHKRMYIMKTRLIKYIENFIAKSWKFSDKKTDIFHISAQT